MFHNASSSRSDRMFTPSWMQDENVIQAHTITNQRLSGLSKRDLSQNENNVPMTSFKTPLSKSERSSHLTSNNNNNTGRRRRALGDISNKKGGLDGSSRKDADKSLSNTISKNKKFVSRIDDTTSTLLHIHNTKSNNNNNSNNNLNKKKVVSFAIHSTEDIIGAKNDSLQEINVSSDFISEVNNEIRSLEVDDLEDIEICAGRTGEEEKALLMKLGHYDDLNLSIDLESMTNFFRTQEEDKIRRRMDLQMSKITITKEDMEREKKILDELQEFDSDDRIEIWMDDDDCVGYGSDDNFSLEDLEGNDEHILISGLDDISI